MKLMYLLATFAVVLVIDGILYPAVGNGVHTDSCN